MERIVLTFICIIIAIVTGCSGDYSLAPSPDYDDSVWVDSFTQIPEIHGVDVIWAIDTSGSMSDKQNILLDGIETMMNALPPHGWRLNMISISPSVVLNDSQFPLVPGDTLEDAIQMYDSMSRGPEEHGFDAVMRYIDYNEYALTWLRHDAALLVVFVSDEDDQSGISVIDFENWYWLQRPVVFLSSIVNLPVGDSSCNTNSVNVGDRYIEATQDFGGFIVDICDNNWSTGVVEASTQIHPREFLRLTHQPISESIRVFYNTHEVAEWEYDESDNTVYFLTTPPANTLVEIAYMLQ
tara:strand:- start:847 stop:1734 length:888 start_codon:yes stop_codon:yes gene_type:complete